ncbi:MAG TPA: GDSL-type esterase/lipase family protein [Planctomycetota bacterium]|nr:GDSL-type esterase/lipase family protein [Planctomycetota bacterium]
MRLPAALLVLAACTMPPPPKHVATTPAPHVEAAERTAVLADRAHLAEAPLILLGDSITEQWETAGARVFAERLAPRQALDLGVSGDRTEHLLWRLKSGEYDHLPVRVAVVLIGSNNLGTRQTPQQTADGVHAVLDDVLARWPHSQVLLLAIFPRGLQTDDPLRLAVEQTNRLLREVANRDRVTWLDFGSVFLAADGTLTPEIMPDALHLSETGYVMWAAEMLPVLDPLLAP